MRRIADLYAKRTTGGCDAEVLIAEATDEVERFLRDLLLCESQRVRLDLRLDGRTDLRRRAKKPVGGHVTVDALMRTLEVVMLDKQLDAAKTVREVREHGLAKKLLPQRLPEAFDLAERLWMLRPALDVRDTVTAHEFLKLRRAAPRCVLTPLVRQHLARFAVLCDAALERLNDQATLLTVRHRPRHEIARVVVHEAGEVNALVTPQLEREDVALPKLVRLRAFEAPRRFVTRLRRHVFGHQAFLVQNAPHHRLRDAEPFEACEHVADPSRAPLRVRRARRDHLGTRHLLRLLLPARHGCTAQLRPQCFHAPARE